MRKYAYMYLAMAVVVTILTASMAFRAEQAGAAPVARTQTSRDCNAAIDVWWTPNVGPAVAQWAKAVVWREARNIPTSANRKSTARGCFQLLMSLHAHRFDKFRHLGCNRAKWGNPDCNALAALDLFRTRGVGKRAWAVTRYTR